MAELALQVAACWPPGRDPGKVVSKWRTWDGRVAFAMSVQLKEGEEVDLEFKGEKRDHGAIRDKVEVLISKGKTFTIAGKEDHKPCALRWRIAEPHINWTGYGVKYCGDFTVVLLPVEGHATVKQLVDHEDLAERAIIIKVASDRAEVSVSSGRLEQCMGCIQGYDANGGHVGWGYAYIQGFYKGLEGEKGAPIWLNFSYCGNVVSE